jgi:hypothetical protein
MTTATKKTTRAKKPNLDLPTNPFLFEILDLASKQRSKDLKVEVLQKYEHPSLKSIFIWNFDETVISMLPEGPVPYSNIERQTVTSGTLSENVARGLDARSAQGQDMNGEGRTSLRNEYVHLYNFVRGGNMTLSQIRRETMFIGIVEALHPREAEILCLVKDKNLEDKYKVPFEVVRQAYPDIVWGNRS